MIETVFRDLRCAVRSIARTPGFAAVAILTLALGIGGNTIIFSSVNGILVEQWPYADASRLLLIEREQIAWGITHDEARTIEEQTEVFEQIAIADGRTQGVSTADGFPSNRSNAEVSGNFFSMLGVEPLLGRYIVASDTEPGGPPVAVLSYQVWRDVFGSDEDVVGREVLVDNSTFTIIGVMPNTFDLGVVWAAESGVWMPLTDTRPDRRNSRLIGKVREGVSLAAAREQLAALSPRLMDRFPAGTDDVALTAEQPRLNIDSNVQSGLLLLQGAIAFVLLLACVNVSALLVARAWSQQRDLTIRKTLGASRSRIVRQLLSESLVLAVAGGALGCVLATGGIRVLLAIAPPGTPRLDRIELDTNVLLFTFGVSVLAAVLFGLLPALQAANRKGDFVRGGLSAISIRTASRQRHWLQNGLVILEVALAVLLVTAGGLMVRSFERLMSIDPGVDAEQTLVVSVQLGRASCAEGCWAANDLLEAINALPGVEQAAASASGALGGGIILSEIRLDGSDSPQAFDGRQNYVSPGFFRTAGMRLLSGRDFASVDETGVAVVNEAFARTYLDGEAVGKRFFTGFYGAGETDEGTWMDVIGVVNDTRNRSLRRFGSGATFYTPAVIRGSFFTLTVRAAGDPNALIPLILQLIRSTDRFAAVASAETLAQSLYDSAALPRFYTALFGFFGVLSLILAVIGVYGVTTYTVMQRTHEVGVRIALGAEGRHVIGRFVAEKAVLAVAGVAAGLAAAAALTRFVEHMLFEIRPLDPATFAGVGALLFVAALVACYLPARAATRTSPVAALRHE